jgi:hypothetical protein
MLWVYAGVDIVRCDRRARMDLPADVIDVTKTTVSNLAETLLTIYTHQTVGRSVYLGFIDPLTMLSQQDEARLRKVFREFQVYMVVSNPFILPFSWKNGLASLVVVGQHNVETSSFIDKCSSPHVSNSV